MQRESDLLLVGDIGGTKTDLRIISPATGARVAVAQARLKSTDYANLDDMLRAFLNTTNLAVRRACLDVAGPVIDGCARLTNLPWKIERTALREALGFETVNILNDLAAIAHAIPTLTSADLVTLNTGVPSTTGTKAVIAPGTGLGEAFLVWNGLRYQPCPSEGGHADFAPPTEALQGLLPYLRQRADHVSYELVCSGIGIPTLYEYFRDSGYAPESPAFAAELTAAPDRTPLIIVRALDTHKPCPLCLATLDAFLSILAAEAGNLALKVLALGGLYIAGGIPPRLASTFKDGRFLDNFCRKGRFAGLLRHIPLYLVTNPDVALLGAAIYGLAQEE